MIFFILSKCIFKEIGTSFEVVITRINRKNQLQYITKFVLAMSSVIVENNRNICVNVLFSWQQLRLSSSFNPTRPQPSQPTPAVAADDNCNNPLVPHIHFNQHNKADMTTPFKIGSANFQNLLQLHLRVNSPSNL